MNAGTGIGIAPAFFTVREGGPVGMSGDEVSLVESGPAGHALLNDFTFAVVSGGACGVFDPGQFKRSPDIPHQPSCQFPELIVQKIRLVTVYQIVSYVFAIGTGASYNHSFS